MIWHAESANLKEVIASNEEFILREVKTYVYRSNVVLLRQRTRSSFSTEFADAGRRSRSTNIQKAS